MRVESDIQGGSTPKTRARTLNTPSSEVKCWVGDVGDVSERVLEKVSMLVMFGLS